MKITPKQSADFQECLSEQVTMFLEAAMERGEDMRNGALQEFILQWGEGEGEFARDVGAAIENLIDAVKRHLEPAKEFVETP